MGGLIHGRKFVLGFEWAYTLTYIAAVSILSLYCLNVHFVTQETKTKLTQVIQKLKETKEEGEQIRADCQAMIKKYQVEMSDSSSKILLSILGPQGLH